MDIPRRVALSRPLPLSAKRTWPDSSLLQLVLSSHQGLCLSRILTPRLGRREILQEIPPITRKFHGNFNFPILPFPQWTNDPSRDPSRNPSGSTQSKEPGRLQFCRSRSAHKPDAPNTHHCDFGGIIVLVGTWFVYYVCIQHTIYLIWGDMVYLYSIKIYLYMYMRVWARV